VALLFIANVNVPVPPTLDVGPVPRTPYLPRNDCTPNTTSDVISVGADPIPEKYALSATVTETVDTVIDSL
jgi:hypothetical protein